MSGCHLDAVNMCCWTHGCYIVEGQYVDGACAEGAAEEEADLWDEDPCWWDEPAHVQEGT